MNTTLVERVINKSVRIATNPIRIMPSFIITGAKKCGTTSLFHYLSEHPNIGAPIKKEISYFDINFAKGNQWYKSFFPISLPGNESPYLITGEATANYICHPQAPQRIAKILPQVKLIALLRNPVDRAYSHYHHTKRIGREDLSFEEALKQEDFRVKQIEQIENNSFNFISNHHGAYNYTYLSSGLYAEQLENWFAHFDEKQFLILKSEDYFSHPEIIFQQVLDFLELPNWSPKRFKKYNYNAYPQKMDSNTRKHLIEYFQPHNEKLYELLGVDFGWNK
ncbi:sulfotransferase domain-containing protein [Pleurocapsa sp. PCC 7319]|uniref:sulfotransferase domain-containing protein n=1 Tax=Pleurocapsa sp. PCC 7319 TaxID=118161 RepID=UPI001181C574|nr:sulfotransferase domain-containing protein [Pleurocapsa sp. PCC 7319]